MLGSKSEATGAIQQWFTDLHERKDYISTTDSNGSSQLSMSHLPHLSSDDGVSAEAVIIDSGSGLKSQGVWSWTPGMVTSQHPIPNDG
jgi:hypothetical protein